MSCKQRIKWMLAVLFVIMSGLAFVIGSSYPRLMNNGVGDVLWQRLQGEVVDLPRATGRQACAEAPFILPTDGWVGIVYGDAMITSANHTGLDIFGLLGNGVTPVYAAYDGYAYREANWVSAVIIRHPEDPLNPSRQIWTYYTHMADRQGNSYIVEAIPPGTANLPVSQGDVIGYQGDYNGRSWRNIGTHLHFSIVRSDAFGNYRNETDINNTLDPSPYLGMRLNNRCADRPPVCRLDFQCPSAE